MRPPQGQLLELPVAPFLASDYLKAAVPAGFNVLDCAEPRWGVVQGEVVARREAGAPPPQHPPTATPPAVIAWHLERR